MAVTVTNAAPPTALNARAEDGNTLASAWVGNYGAPANCVVLDVTGHIANKGRIKVTELQLSGTYATGGFALTPSAYGLKEINSLAVICDASATSGAVAVPSLATAGESPIVKLVVSNSLAELANTTSVASMNFDVILVGR